MKKLFIVLFITVVFCQFGNCATSQFSNSTQSIMRELKDAVVNDVTNSVNTTVNGVKLAGYKAQLEQKQNELKELENSSCSTFIKTYKRYKLKQQISELEQKIRTLESQIR